MSIVNSREYLKGNILTKSYEDGIIECLAILSKWTDIGIYDVPIKYLREPMEDLLTTPTFENSQNIHYDSSQKITGVYENPYDKEYNV
jgi:hypothetical protein